MDQLRNNNHNFMPESGKEIFARMATPALLSSMISLLHEPQTGKYMAAGLMAGYTAQLVSKKDITLVPSAIGSAGTLNNLSMAPSGMAYEVMSALALFYSAKKENRVKSLIAGFLAVSFNSAVTSIALGVDQLDLLDKCEKGEQIEREGFECPKIEPPKADIIPR